jgi:predicted aldo/keto reductase-like oxidoreductase
VPATRLLPRPLGGTGLWASPLGLATMGMRFGGERGLELTGEDCERAFYDHGVNTFLANRLTPTTDEGARRLIRAGYRDDIVVAAEVGLPFAGSVRRGLEHYLRAIGTDYLDILIYGWVRRRWHVRPAVWHEMERLRASGRVRAIGFSSHNRDLAAELARALQPDVLMIRYNAAHRGAEREVFAPLEPMGEARPAIIAYTATRWSMLLKPVPERGFPQAMTGPECYRFVLGHPSVDMAWCAARTMAELKEDVAGVLEGPLAPDRLAEVQRFGEVVHAAARGGRRWMFGANAN